MLQYNTPLTCLQQKFNNSGKDNDRSAIDLFDKLGYNYSASLQRTQRILGRHGGT